jgi:hypothetical protein
VVEHPMVEKQKFGFRVLVHYLDLVKLALPGNQSNARIQYKEV